MAKRYKHPGHNRTIYLAWVDMRKRCLNPKNEFFHQYGGAGVRICKKWENDYEAFLEWSLSNGWKPGLQIDKDILGSGKLYSPKTCKWVTPRENANKRGGCVYVVFNGRKQTLMEVSRKAGIGYNVLRNRIVNLKMNVADAASLPVKHKTYKRKIFYMGKRRTIKEIAEIIKIPHELVRSRLKYYNYKNVPSVIDRLKDGVKNHN